MMIKIFTQGNDGKIALTPEELRSLLDEAYWEGYKANCKTVTYTTPNWTPYVWNGSSITLTTNANGTESTETVFVGDAKMEVNT